MAGCRHCRRSALIGILWSCFGRRVPVIEAAPAVGKAQGNHGPQRVARGGFDSPAPDQAKPIVTMLSRATRRSPSGAESQPPSAKPAAVQANGKVDINLRAA